jgi:hypothetical protein
MTEVEIEDMKKELILLRMHKKRLEEDIQKMQMVIKDILIGQISEELTEEKKDIEENAVTTTTGHSENIA